MGCLRPSTRKDNNEKLAKFCDMKRREIETYGRHGSYARNCAKTSFMCIFKTTPPRRTTTDYFPDTDTDTDTDTNSLNRRLTFPGTPPFPSLKMESESQKTLTRQPEPKASQEAPKSRNEAVARSISRALDMGSRPAKTTFPSTFKPPPTSPCKVTYRASSELTSQSTLLLTKPLVTPPPLPPTIRPSVPTLKFTSSTSTPTRTPSAPSSKLLLSAVKSKLDFPVQPCSNSPFMKFKPLKPIKVPGCTLDVHPNLMKKGRLGAEAPPINSIYAESNEDISYVMLGNEMVERIINKQKLTPAKKEHRRSPAMSSSQFETLSEKSFHMAMRDMVIKENIARITQLPSEYSRRYVDPPLATSSNTSCEVIKKNISRITQASSKYSRRYVDPPLTTSSNTSCEVTVDGSELVDDVSSDKGVTSQC